MTRSRHPREYRRTGVIRADVQPLGPDARRNEQGNRPEFEHRRLIGSRTKAPLLLGVRARDGLGPPCLGLARLGNAWVNRSHRSVGEALGGPESTAWA